MYLLNRYLTTFEKLCFENTVSTVRGASGKISHESRGWVGVWGGEARRGEVKMAGGCFGLKSACVREAVRL